MLTLYIGNKNYSSWSLRPWILLKHFGIAFSEKLVGVAGRGANDLHRGYSANGLVPCLHVEGFQVWDTLAIAEFLAETYPDLNLWPRDRLARARARSISAEMHSGFANLRGKCGMNIKLRLKGAPVSEAVQADIDRIVQAWTDARAMPTSQTGPYLFGEFSVADAMFAPVIWRFFTYNISLPPIAAQYVQTMLAHPAMKEWEQAALQETNALAHYDDAALADFGGPRD
jgi:glutathione S-transferase